jgi:multidrug efflux pump subunit AcrB
MVVDIFPAINIPVVGIVWSYPGLSAIDMERRVVLLTERALSTTVGGIKNIESSSIPGVGLLRIYWNRSRRSDCADQCFLSVSPSFDAARHDRARNH